MALIESTLTWLNLKHLPLATVNNPVTPISSKHSSLSCPNHLSTVASYVKRAMQTTHPHVQRKKLHAQTKVDITSRKEMVPSMLPLFFNIFLFLNFFNYSSHVMLFCISFKLPLSWWEVTDSVTMAEHSIIPQGCTENLQDLELKWKVLQFLIM